MPLLFSQRLSPDTRFGLWYIAEDEAFFRKELPLSDAEANELALHKGIRRLEWLSGRWLLHQLTGSSKRMPLSKNAFAKPFFLENPSQHCSLSHSKGLVGALLAKQNCGFDVQVVVEKMGRIAHKFVGEQETLFLEKQNPEHLLDLLHVYWTAKESIYKAYGLKALDFRQHIFIDDFEWNGKNGRTNAWVRKGGFEQLYQLFFEKIRLPGAPTLVWCICLEV